MALVVLAVDPQRVRRGHLKVVECSAVERDMDVGTWSVTVLDNDLSRRVGEGWRVLIVDGDTRISGPVLSYGGEHGANTFTFSGEDELHYPASRIIYPSPSRSAEQQTEDAYYKRTGLSGDLVRAMVRESLGDLALSSRQVPGAAIGSATGLGVQASTNLRYKNLLEEARALARAGGFTFSAVQEQDARIVTRFRAVRDLSRRVRFTDRNGGLSGGSWSVTAPTVTSVLVAGQGQGADRTIKEHTADSGDWGLRIEQFQDRRDTDDAGELEAAGVDTLAEGAAGASATVETTEPAGLRYGTDFLLGDTVTVDFGRAQIAEPVRAVELSWDGQGRTATLTLGDHETDDDQDPAWVKHVRDLGKRLRGLETI